ncbi:MAG: PLDc N-terminal domain-containing protein [Bacteroidales bacterium]
MEALAKIGSSPLFLVFSLVYLLTAAFLCLMIIFENRSPVKTLSWVLVVLLVPVLGILLYFMFGQYYRKKKIFSRKGLIDMEFLSHMAMQQVNSLEERLKSK